MLKIAAIAELSIYNPLPALVSITSSGVIKKGMFGCATVLAGTCRYLITVPALPSLILKIVAAPLENTDPPTKEIFLAVTAAINNVFPATANGFTVSV